MHNNVSVLAKQGRNINSRNISCLLPNLISSNDGVLATSNCTISDSP